MPEHTDDAWEHDDTVHRTITLPADLAGQLAAEAARHGISLSDLLTHYAEQGLHHAQ
jgi:hypothetical protein